MHEGNLPYISLQGGDVVCRGKDVRMPAAGLQVFYREEREFGTFYCTCNVRGLRIPWSIFETSHTKEIVTAEGYNVYEMRNVQWEILPRAWSPNSIQSSKQKVHHIRTVCMLCRQTNCH